MSFDPISYAMGKAAGSGGGVEVESLSVTENGTYTAPTGKAYSPVTVNVTGVDPEADVRFFDPYDGSVVASYSAADFANLTELPANPTHEGLVSQGWNWTLADAKEQVAWAGFLDIGQQYVPTDGKTHVHVHMVDGALSPKMKLSVKGTVTVNWGDGTAEDEQTATGSSYTDKTFTHTYAAPGDYEVKIGVSDGDYKITGTNYGSNLFSSLKNSQDSNAAYNLCLKKVEIGSNASVDSNGFRGCQNTSAVTLPNNVTFVNTGYFQYSGIKTISVPQGITAIGYYAFMQCRSLQIVSLPKSCKSLGTQMFLSAAVMRVSVPKEATTVESLLAQSASVIRFAFPSSVSDVPGSCLASTSIKRVTVPSNITSIKTSAFSGCKLEHIELPNTLTTIGESAFNNCSYLQEISLPSSLTTIDKQAFYYCNALSNIIIPAAVTNIGTQCFSSCYGLGKIKFLGSTPPTVGSNAFIGISSDCKILVPAGSLSAYTGTSNMPSSSTYTYEEY